VIAEFPRGDGSFSTLAGVTQLFANPWLLLAGRLHYLAFDLLIGPPPLHEKATRRSSLQAAHRNWAPTRRPDIHAAGSHEILARQIAEAPRRPGSELACARNV
jgi:hypothetical protein